MTERAGPLRRSYSKEVSHPKVVSTHHTFVEQTLFMAKTSPHPTPPGDHSLRAGSGCPGVPASSTVRTFGFRGVQTPQEGRDGGPWEDGEAMEGRPRTAEVGPTDLHDGGSEGPQDGCSTPAVSLHPGHGGLGTAQGGERAELALTGKQVPQLPRPTLPRLTRAQRGSQTHKT